MGSLQTVIIRFLNDIILFAQFCNNIRGAIEPLKSPIRILRVLIAGADSRMDYEDKLVMWDFCEWLFITVRANENSVKAFCWYVTLTESDLNMMLFKLKDYELKKLEMTPVVASPEKANEDDNINNQV